MKAKIVLKICLLLVLLCVTNVDALAEDCKLDDSLKQFSQTNLDPDYRGLLASCLIKNYLSNSRVSKTMLKSLTNNKEHVFIKEDILEALSLVSFRKNIKVEQALAPEISKQEAHAMDRTLASAKNILDVTKTVKSMNEVIPVTKYEEAFVATLASYITNDETNVLLRIGAVKALNHITENMIDSGIYEEKLLYTVYDAFRKTAAKNDNSSYYSGASGAYHKLETLFQRYAVNMSKFGLRTGRQISSLNQ